MTALRGAAVTDVGRVRSVNQDGALTSGFLAAVADGMGGHRAGEVASAVALRSLADHEHFASADDLVAAVRRANSSIFRRATATANLRGMGTTLCALALVGGGADEGTVRLAVVNVGDSRAYQLRDGDLAQLTIDHSLVQMMVREGKLRPEEAATHPQRNIVLRALGIEPDVEVDHWELDAVVGDRFLVCSDGLFNEVAEGRMAATLRTYAEPAEAAKVLVGLANAGGGRDNITCVVVDIVDDVAVDIVDDVAVDGGPAEVVDDDRAGVADEGDTEIGVPEPGEPGTAGSAGAAARAGGTGAATAAGEPTVALGVAVPGARTASVLAELGTGSGRGAERAGTTLLTALPLDEITADDLDLDGAGDGAALGRRGWRPRRLTLRVAAFVAVIVVVLGVAVAAVGWYATRTYFVAFEGDQVVIYQGRPGGLLWIEPTVAEQATPSLDRTTLVGALCDRVEGQPSATSLGDAREIVEQLRRDAAALGVPRTPCGGSA